MTWYQDYMKSLQQRRGLVDSGTWPFVNWSSFRITEESRASESGESNMESRSSGTGDSQNITPRSSVGSITRSPGIDGQAAGRRDGNGAFWTLSPQRRF